MRPRATYLDFGPVTRVPLVAASAERAGFHRYWLGEHRGPARTSNPLLGSALAAAATSAIRVGAGGVCLPLHAPLRVLEDALAVSSLFPGRLDLGVCNGMGLPRPVLEALLDGRAGPGDFYERAAELLRLLRDEGRGSGTGAAGALPRAAERDPAVWMLGMSEAAARFAGRHGVGFVFSEYHNPGDVDGRRLLDVYRGAFTAHRPGDRPYAVVAQGGICGESQEMATALATRAASRFERAALLPSGTAPALADALARLGTSVDADEVAYVDLFWTLPEYSDARLAGIESLGAALREALA